MFIRFNTFAALVTSAAFVYSSLSFAQAPIIDASVDRNPPPSSVQPAGDPANAGSPMDANVQAELLYQLQLLQQEVMQLRGVVEEQAHMLRQMKEQNMERYIDLDKRLGELAVGAPATGPAAGSGSPSSATAKVAALPGEKSRYNAAYKLVTGKRFEEALEAFKLFLVDFPDGKYAPNSYYWLGELYQVVSPQNLEASRQAFTQLLDQYPSHSKAADAMYKLGKVYYAKGNEGKSRQWLERVIAEYGNGVNAAADKARQFLKTKF
jgi:tol-pal system protein YbgF